MTDKNLDIKMENCSLTDSIEQNHEDKVVIEEEEEENSIYKSATIADLNSPQPINSKIEKMSPGLAKRVSQSPEQFSPISNQISPNSASSTTSSSSSSANLKIQHALEKNMQKLNLVPKNKFVKNSNLTKEDIELFTANNINDNEVISQFSPNQIRNSLSNTNSRNSANREMTPDSIDENYYVNTNPKPKKKNPNLVKPRVVNRVSQIGVSSSSTSSSISSNLSSPITNQQIAKKINKKQLMQQQQQQQQQQHLEPLQFNRNNNKNKQTQPRHLKQPIVQNNQLNTKQLIHKKKIQVKKNSVIHHQHQQKNNNLQKNIVYQDNDDDDDEEQSEFDDYNQEDNFEHDDELDEEEYEEEDCDNENYQDYEDQQDEEEDFYEEDNENYENYHYEKNSKFMKQQAEKINSKLVKNINPLSPHNQKYFQNKKPISRPNTLITNNNSNKNNKPNVSQSAFIEPISNKNSLNTSASSSTSTIHSNQNIKLTTNTTTTKSNNSYQSNQINSNNIQSNSDRDYDTDEETNKLLLEASKQQQQQQSSKLSNENSQTTEQCKNMIEAKQQKSRENQIHQIMDPDNQVLIEGVLFRARYLGSTQLVTDGNPTKLTRMLQAQEAVGRIKVTIFSFF
ncbi:unnamed protein product [Brachionus calyciflorus]|uniref:PID domain-containing protein n=1 Tax=Brachionus calyciflorus TaxID=104777 RepID=A0A813QGK2_9BILA|nr:unnamed protein product [Brachionus calyciflorus]